MSSWTTAGTWLLHCGVGGGLLLLLTCFLVSRARQPAIKQRLGEWGLAAALVVALLSLVGPAWLIVAWPAADAPPIEAPPSVPVFDVFLPDEPGQPGRADWPPVAPDVLAEPIPPLPPELAALPRRVEGPAIPWWRSLAADLLPGLVALYALGAAFLLGRWLLGHAVLIRLLRRATPAPAEMAQLFASVAGRPRTPRLLVSRRVRMPISCGLLRPTVVLPESMCQAPARRLRWVFLHELTHLERRDAWSALLFALGQAIYFLLPWFWWLRRQVRLCQEYVADAAAAGQDPAADYAEFLLTLTGAPAVPAAATGVSGPTSDLFRRVRMLLQKPVQVEKRCPRRWSLAAAGGLFALAVVVAGIGLRAEASPPVIVIATQDKDAKTEGKQVRVFVLPAPEQKQPGDVILLKKVVDKAEDPIVEGYRKEIARHEQLLADVRARSVNPEQQPVYQSAKAALAEAEKRLAERLHQLRSLPGKELIEIEIRGDKLKIDPKHQDAIRKGLEWLRKTQADKKIELPKGFKFDFNLDGLDLGQEAGQKGIEAGLEAVQKALKELEQHRGQPEVEAARQQLQKVRDRLAELKKARPGFERKVVPAQPIDPQTLQKLREELKKHPEAAELLKALEAFEQKHKVVPDHRHRVWEMWVPDKKGLIVRPAGQAGLGVEVEKPSSALADQLDLPKGQGVVITKVRTDSPAAKAGLRANDVILELNGKPVRNDPVEFAGQVAKLDTAADVTVLRKGKRETVKGIKLAAAEAGIVRWGVRAHEPMVVPFGPMGGRQGDVMTTVLRTEDRFTTRYQEGSLVITVTGTVVGGKAKAGEIHIHDGRADHKYDSVEGVPAQYRDKVNHLLAISAQGQFRIERK